VHRSSRLRPTTRACAAILVVAALSVTGLTTRAPVASAATTSVSSSTPAYWLVASDGGIFSFGGAGFYGSMGGRPLNKPVVGIAAVPGGGGYWEVASDGGIFSFGSAQFYGSMGGRPLNKPVVGIAAVPGGGGYWEVASDGGVFAFGSAQFYGSMGGRPLNKPVVGIAAVPGGGGYWEVASDGGIFAFGSAQFYGSTGNLSLNAPIVSMTPYPSGAGYWFTASDGGIFAYGASQFYGSLGGTPQSRPVVAMAATPGGQGYWITNNNGAVSNFGSAAYLGSAPQILNAPIVGMAETAGSGQLGAITFPIGSYGYDISNFQCKGFPPAPHAIGIVETNGWGNAAPNQCLAQEATWAGAGLNLYTFLSCTTNGPSAGAPYCTYTTGEQEAQYAFDLAQATGVDTQVTWWLDVETAPGSWSPTRTANSDLVAGAIAELRALGINNVGIYASPAVWPDIVGPYQPPVPYWVALWGTNPATTCLDVHTRFGGLPTGPVALVQYSAPTYPYEAGGMTTAFDNDYAC
jgi:hypothetical protein